MHITSEVTGRLIEIVRRAARDEILPRFRNLPVGGIDTKTSETDLVTIADRAAEARIGDEARQLIPGAQIVGEEAVGGDRSLLDRIGSAELCVIIDPIDGTWNYVKGLPLFGVMVAIVEERQTRFGLLYDPITDSWIQATAQKGARYQSHTGEKRILSVGNSGLPGTTGFIPLYLFSKETQQKLAPRLPMLDRASSLRCSCHEYWLLSEGAVDFGISGQLNPWDHAAGELIYREAGGFSAMMEDGSAYDASKTSGQLLVARNRHCWSKVRDLLEGAFS